MENMNNFQNFSFIHDNFRKGIPGSVTTTVQADGSYCRFWSCLHYWIWYVLYWIIYVVFTLLDLVCLILNHLYYYKQNGQAKTDAQMHGQINRMLMWFKDYALKGYTSIVPCVIQNMCLFIGWIMQLLPSCLLWAIQQFQIRNKNISGILYYSH
jgi:hypothetical protein